MPHDSASRAAYRDFLADADDFVPGLKPRIHAGSAAEFLAKYDREPEDDLATNEEPTVDLETWRRLAHPLLSRPGSRALAALRAIGADSTPDEPDMWRDRSWLASELRRIAAARLDVDAFEPCNPQQRELVGLLRALLDYLEANRRAPDESFERQRWWRNFAAFRRALEFPEMTGPRRRAAFDTLVDLKETDLLAVARRGRMAHRMPNRRSTQGRRP